MRRSSFEGLRYVLRHRYWRPMAITTGASNFFWMICGSILLVYAVRSLGMSPELIGLVLTLGSLGGLAGAFAAGRLSRRFGVGPTIVGASVLFGPPLVLVPLAPASSPIPVLVLAFLVSTAGGTIYVITGLSLMQTLARAPARPDERDPPVHRLRRDPARLADRRGARVLDRPAPDSVGRRDRRLLASSMALSPIRHIGAMPTEPSPTRCPSAPRSRQACTSMPELPEVEAWCGSSTRSSRSRRSSAPGRRMSRR